MKKKLILVVSTLLLFCFLFSGCGGKDEALSKLMYGLKPSMTMQQVSDYFEEKGYEVTYESSDYYDYLILDKTVFDYADKYVSSGMWVCFKDGNLATFVSVVESPGSGIEDYLTSTFGNAEVDGSYDYWCYNDHKITLKDGSGGTLLCEINI